jgi:hypothetical protein
MAQAGAVLIFGMLMKAKAKRVKKRWHWPFWVGPVEIRGAWQRPRSYKISADGFPGYPSAIENTLFDRCDFAQFIKVYRATPQGERSYSPAEVVAT